MVPIGDANVFLVRDFAAPPDRVFSAWTNPAIAAKWLFRTPEGLAVRAETDPQEGGEFIFVEDRADERIVHVGEYLALEAPRVLDFVFSLDHFRTTNEVHVRFEPEGGGTRVTLTHKLDPQWVAFKDRTENGWSLMLDTLGQVLGELG